MDDKAPDIHVTGLLRARALMRGVADRLENETDPKWTLHNLLDIAEADGLLSYVLVQLIESGASVTEDMPF